MTDPEPISPDDAVDVRKLAKAVRTVVFGAVIGFSLFNVGIVRSIRGFEMIFNDMLGGKPLPFLTQLVIEGRLVCLAIAGIIPALALGALLSRRVVPAIYVLSALGLIAILEAAIVFLSLFAPLIQIIRLMGAGSGI
jgi:hypothetical protein